MAASDRVRQILAEVRSLSDEEKAELVAEDAVSGRLRGREADRRAARVLAGEAAGLRRDEVRSLFSMSPAEARTRLAALLDARKVPQKAIGR